MKIYYAIRNSCFDFIRKFKAILKKSPRGVYSYKKISHIWRKFAAKP